MFDQVFSLLDVPRLITLIFLEGILSLDNALAIAIIVRTLPPFQRQKALFIGLVSAVILRAMGILGAAFLIKLFWVQLLGGLYLIYLSARHLYLSTRPQSSIATGKQRSFWMTVVMVEFTDFMFAVDSILAGLALIGVNAAFTKTASKALDRLCWRCYRAHPHALCRAYFYRFH